MFPRPRKGPSKYQLCTTTYRVRPPLKNSILFPASSFMKELGLLTLKVKPHLKNSTLFPDIHMFLLSLKSQASLFTGWNLIWKIPRFSQTCICFFFHWRAGAPYSQNETSLEKFHKNCTHSQTYICLAHCPIRFQDLENALQNLSPVLLTGWGHAAACSGRAGGDVAPQANSAVGGPGRCSWGDVAPGCLSGPGSLPSLCQRRRCAAGTWPSHGGCLRCTDPSLPPLEVCGLKVWKWGWGGGEKTTLLFWLFSCGTALLDVQQDCPKIMQERETLYTPVTHTIHSVKTHTPGRYMDHLHSSSSV